MRNERRKERTAQQLVVFSTRRLLGPLPSLGSLPSSLVASFPFAEDIYGLLANATDNSSFAIRFARRVSNTVAAGTTTRTEGSPSRASWLPREGYGGRI